MPTEPKYFNSHAHCFTIDHVPENFFDELIGGKRFLRITNIKNSKGLQSVIKLLTGSFVRWVIGIFSPYYAHQLQRLHGLIKYAIEPSQDILIKKLNDYYHEKYRMVMLTMDMEFMGAGGTIESFETQLQKLKAIKQNAEWQPNIFPFIFADPNRYDITNLVKQYLTNKEAPFQGIKLYPAIGYYPFDKRLKDIYNFAIENNVPLLTHCIVGDVHQRDTDYHKRFPIHPFSQQSTTPDGLKKDNKLPENFQINFTHPLNYECLLNKTLASNYFGELVDFSSLKICIGHFGGEKEWKLFKTQEQTSNTTYKQVYAFDPLDINQPWLGNDNTRYSWLKIIKELIRRYPNVYADISYILHDESIYPILKSMLKDETLKNRILYGTDYYVVASETEEPSLIATMTKYLTPDEIRLISYDNPLLFLSSKLNPLNS